MTFALLATLLATAWTDPTGRLRCEVPEAFTPLPDQPWRFSRADGLRQLVFLTVKPVPQGPTERAKQLLARTGAADLASTDRAASGRLTDAPQLAAALAIAAVEPTWAGVLVLGPPAADVAAEANTLAGACHKVTPSFANGRVFDTTRRLSAAVPPFHQANEVRGAGAVQGQGYAIRLTSVQPMTKSLQETAIAWLAPSGARLTATSGASAGANELPVVIATGSLVVNGVEFLIEIAAIDLGNGEVGGLGLSANAAVTSRARGAMEDMLRTIAVEPRPRP